MPWWQDRGYQGRERDKMEGDGEEVDKKGREERLGRRREGLCGLCGLCALPPGTED